MHNILYLTLYQGNIRVRSISLVVHICTTIDISIDILSSWYIVYTYFNVTRRFATIKAVL